MKYRTYNLSIIGIILSLTLAACATTETGMREPAAESERQGIDGNEPKEPKENPKFSWLDKVGDDFGKIAAETSNRTVASEAKRQTLIQKNGWAFYFSPKANQFYLSLQGREMQMVQTSLGDGDTYAFAAEGQGESPVTLSLLRETGRQIASGQKCNVELAYWNAQSRAYTKEATNVEGKSCAQLVKKLKDYIP